jgi:hypothetical protein
MTMAKEALSLARDHQRSGKSGLAQSLQVVSGSGSFRDLLLHVRPRLHQRKFSVSESQKDDCLRHRSGEIVIKLFLRL